MKSYIQVILKAMKEQAVSVDELVNASHAEKKDIEEFLAGKKDVSLEELVRIVTYLHLDLNEVMGIRVVKNHSYMMITDEMEQHVNAIARSIRKKDRKKFERAVEYLAECFGDKWSKKRNTKTNDSHNKKSI